jgi:DNA-binding transcriptional regulator YhcF (GntR family)
MGNCDMSSKGRRVPKYFQLKESLLEKIKSGEYMPGDRMPSERELIRTTGLSMPTVRRAYDELARDKFVTRIQGSGTVVLEWQSRKPQLRVGIFAPRSIYQSIKSAIDVIEAENGDSSRIETVLLESDMLLEEGYRLCDVVIPGEIRLAELREQKLAIPLRGHISLDSFDSIDYLSQYLTDDQLHALPLTWSPLALCCNMNQLRKLDFEMPEHASREDLLRLTDVAADYRRRTGQNVFAFPCTMSYQRWLPFLWQDGCDIFYSESYDRNAMWKSVEFLRRFFQAESCYMCPKKVPMLNEELFARGNFAFAFVSSYHIAGIARQFRALDIDWRLYDFPIGKRRITCMTSLPFSVSAFSENKSAAIDLCKKLLSEKIQLQLFKESCFLPVVPVSRQKLREAVEPECYDAVIKFMDSAVYGRSPKVKNYNRINKFTQYLGMYLSKLISIDEFKDSVSDICPSVDNE